MDDQTLRSTNRVYFVTTVVYNRLRIFTRPSTIIPIYDSLNFYCAHLKVRLLGYVVMPDHLHLLLWPMHEADVKAFMRDFKTFTAKRIIRQAEAEGQHDWLDAFERAGAEIGRSKHKVWQDDFWEVTVYNERFLRQKLNYIHRNPVRHGLVKEPDEYVYSSYRSYVFGEDWLVKIDRGWS